MASDPRKVGIPYGRDEYTERITRTVHADGTVTDSEPTRTAAGANWQALFQQLKAPGQAAGTRRILLQRTVTTEATAWAEVPVQEQGRTITVEGAPRDESDLAGHVSGD